MFLVIGYTIIQFPFLEIPKTSAAWIGLALATGLFFMIHISLLLTLLLLSVYVNVQKKLIEKAQGG